MAMEFNLTQPQRLGALGIDLLIVMLVCWVLFDTVYPPLGDKGFWAYSALLAVMVGSKLVTPFYVKPVDAISYAVPALISMALINHWNIWTDNQKWGFALSTGFSALVLLVGIATIFVNGFTSDDAKKLSNQLRVILGQVGRPELIYTPLVLFSVFSFHRESWVEAVVICVALIVTVWWSVGEYLFASYMRIKGTFLDESISGIAGQVIAYQEPGIVLLRQQYDGDIKPFDVLCVNDKHAPSKLVVALDYVGRSEGILVRTVEISQLKDESQLKVGKLPYSESAYHIEKATLDDICKIENINQSDQSSVVGLVAPDSSIEVLYFEVVKNSNLEKGRLVSVSVGSNKVLYQILSGLTKEEIVQQKNSYGFVRAQAQQIGIWDKSKNKFVYCSWLPTLQAPVYLVGEEETVLSINSIGVFPKTNFQAEFKNINELVTHNTAILGILGIGKTMLSVEIIERLLSSGIKVICIDLTDEYKSLLNEYYCGWWHEYIVAEINKIASTSKANVSKHVEDGGGVKKFKAFSKQFIQGFIDDKSVNLLIINPSDFEVWRQDSKPYGTEASMASLTPTEITHILTEAALEVVQKLGKMEAGKARLCLVYEEAHSLVPEFNSVVAPGDKAATNGTARAILQGRKYGMGCLLITQRTANVTKTILNQCNTIFAMRTYDDTGKEFLSNYLGKSYAESLHSLQPQQAVFFGKASSCENPILISLNDRDTFISEFRKTNVTPALPANPNVAGP